VIEVVLHLDHKELNKSVIQMEDGQRVWEKKERVDENV